jgi:hypothetical protein
MALATGSIDTIVAASTKGQFVKQLCEVRRG